jgi:ACS family hexuronate transporter-like MFS transporter
MKATAEWFPARERGLAGGVYNIGASFGSMLAPPLVAWAILRYNWQATFVITGSLGFAWLILWFLFYDSPDRHRALSPEERRYIVSGQEKHLKGDGRPSVRQILGQRNFWAIALPRLLADPTWGTLTFWLLLYLTTVRHFDLKQIALFAWLPFLAADFGCVFGGAFSLALQKYAGLSLLNARRSAFTLGACLMLGVGFAGVVQSPYTAIALLSLAGFAHQTLSVTVITMSSDLFRKNEASLSRSRASTPMPDMKFPSCASATPERNAVSSNRPLPLLWKKKLFSLSLATNRSVQPSRLKSAAPTPMPFRGGREFRKPRRLLETSHPHC